MSRLIAAGEQESSPLSDIEIVDTCMLIFADGVENVDSGIGNCMLTLLQNEDQMNRLANEPHLLENAIDECLRYEPPAQFIPRIAKEDISIGDTTIKRNQTVLLALASANRDPEVFSNPDRVDIAREDLRHLAFGRGRHSCIGGPLVIREFTEAISAILDNFGGLELSDGPPRWIARRGHRWPEALKVSLKAY